MGCGTGSCGCGGGGEAPGGPHCYTCDKCALRRTRRRLAALKACEKFCGNDCSPFATLADVMAVARRLGTTVDGWGQFDVNGKTICLPDVEKDCAVWGPHGNCAKRDADYSPSDVEAVIAALSLETLVGEGIQLAGNLSDWMVFPFGGLGVSHVTCLHTVSVTGVAAGGGTVDLTADITNIGIAGARLVCADNDSGSYLWAIDRACLAETGWDITEGRCRCVEPPCAATPSGTGGGGQEFILLEFSGIDIGDFTDVTVTSKVKRCDWGLCVDAQVCTRKNRVLFSTVPGIALPRRYAPGNIPLLP